MSSTEVKRAQTEARRDVTAHTERKQPHADALTRYLAGLAYAEARTEREQTTTGTETETGSPESS
jgi:hypothetical protein